MRAGHEVPTGAVRLHWWNTPNGPIAIEFDSLADIRAQHGLCRSHRFTPAYGSMAPITDDTQMTLFTAEGLIRAGLGADPEAAAP